MADSYPHVRLAAVQAAPVFLDRDATVTRACELIEEAGRNGAQLLAFPEGYIPGHPLWYHFHAASGRKSAELARRLFKNAVTIPGPEVDAIALSARQAGVYVVMGCCEKEPTSRGTMYNTVFAIDQQGRLVGARRKITPTLGERLVHAPAAADSVRVFDSDWGPVSALICGENSNPLLGFSMQALGAVIHVACWPSHFTPMPMMQDIIPLTTRAFAYQAGVFVVNAVGGISDEMLELLPLTDDDHEFLQRSIKLGGGASIVAPGGAYLAGPMGEGEGIVYADADLEAVVRRKIVQDYAGHYNRSDIFTLQISGERSGLLEFR